MITPYDLQKVHAGFLKAELDLGRTFTTIATHRHQIGHEESAVKSLVNAGKAYETVDRLLSDPMHSHRLTTAEVRDLSAELEGLREELVKLERSMTQLKVKGARTC